jgi:hypothetical protein
MKQVIQRYGNLPLSFEINEGQVDRRTKFLSRGPGYELFLTATGLVLTLSKPAAPVRDNEKFSARKNDAD